MACFPLHFEDICTEVCNVAKNKKKKLHKHNLIYARDTVTPQKLQTPLICSLGRCIILSKNGSSVNQLPRGHKPTDCYDLAS